MKMFDILIEVKGNLEWVTGIYQDDVNSAITNAIQLFGKGKYVGHNEFNIVNGEWVKS